MFLLSSSLSLFASTAVFVCQRLESSVYPIIDGKQLNLLELYFSVLNQTTPVSRSERLLPKDHLKLLSKVKATTAGTYKILYPHHIF